MSGIPAGAGSLLGKRLGKYEILALLALGGTAEIYLARIGGAAGFEKYVVVKCLHDHLADDQEFVKMFLDEARLAAHLDHSNIVQTMELGEQDNRYYMVMEFLAGLSLAMIVRRVGERLPDGRMPIPLALNILAQSCAGLHYAHEKAMNGKALNIVHRDISPQNLVVSFEGVVKVVDFGIAKAELRETRTRSGTIKGKFAYMSPEQCVANNVDRRTDVFALGVIGHELLTGRRLFKKPSPYETYQAVIECNVDPPSKLNIEVDPAIDPIIMRAVCKDKDQRYPTAEAFGDALLSYLHHRGKGSGPGDVARFFDTSFAQEIEEHSTRMRELISGRDFGIDSGAKWDADEEARRKEDSKRNETLDITTGTTGDEKSMSLDSMDMIEVDRPSSGSLSDVIDDLGDGKSEDEEDMPAERTRIEANPLQRLSELDNEVVKQKTPAPQLLKPMPNIKSQPHQAAQMPPSGPLRLPPPPTSPISGGAIEKTPKPAKKFPDLANLPTMIAEPEEGPDDSPELARTVLGAGGIDLGDSRRVDPMARTSMDMVAPSPNGAPRPSAQMQPLSGPPEHPSHASMHPQANVPTGYPVMNAQLSEQIATGATVFPSSSSGPRGSVPDSGPQLDPQRAADLASPVGQHYPEQVDWAAAAALPAKPIAGWMLAVIFLGAIGVALAITIVIAKIIR